MILLAGSDRLVITLDDQLETIVSSVQQFLVQSEYVEIFHGFYGVEDKNLMQLARVHRELRPLIFALAENGFVAYDGDARRTNFTRQKNVSVVWDKVISGRYTVDPSGLVYTLTEPRDNQTATCLITVFSSMSNPFDQVSLDRFFEQNFSSIPKHVPDSAAILRIADVGGVVGGFYLPTTYCPRSPHLVIDLVTAVSRQLGFSPREKCVLYGASKGATGALYCSLLSGIPVVAVDPVLDDSLYEERYRDTHWTKGGIFVQRKEELFRDAAEALKTREDCSALRCLVTGNGSFLAESVKAFAELLPRDDTVLLVSNDPRITDHPHVSIRTLKTVTGLINCLAVGIKPQPGKYSI